MHTSPPSTSRRTVGRSRSISARKLGTVEKNVTRLAVMNSATSSGERATGSGATTSVPPIANAPQISSTEASNATEKPW